MKAIHRFTCGAGGGAIFMYAAICVAVVGVPAMAQTGTEGSSGSSVSNAAAKRTQKIAPITFGRALPDKLDAPILDAVIVDHRDGGATLDSVGTVSAAAVPGDACRFTAQCNDCNPCTVDSCTDEVCVGGNRDGFTCNVDTDCEGLCAGGERNGLLCRDDLDCCGDGDAIVDGSCSFNPCTTFTTGGAEGTGGNQCVNSVIPEFGCDSGNRDGQLCDPNIDPSDLTNGCPGTAQDPTVGSCIRRFEPGSECDDGVICNGRETCNLSTSTCVAGDPSDVVSVASFRCDSGQRVGLTCDELGGVDECPPPIGGEIPGACVSTRVACEAEGTLCDEDTGNCVQPCLSEIDCPDDGSACTVAVCNAKLCVGGETPNVPCRDDSNCGTGTCSGGGDGSCSVDNPCGGGECFNGAVCDGGLDGEPCNTAADCDDGSPGGGQCPTPPNGFSCLKGRCCVDGACSRSAFLDCQGDGGIFFGTALACQTTGSGNFNVCPSYSGGIAPQDNAILEVGSVIAPQGIACDLLLTGLGDDYKIGDGTGFVTATFARFLISVQSTARLQFGFWDANGVFILDTLVNPIGVSGPAIHTLDFDPPIVIPATGFVSITVDGAFSPAGSFSWLSIDDAVDVGTGDPNRMLVNGAPTDGSSFNLGQCSGGVRDGLWCNAATGDVDCTGGVCADVNDNFAFEIVAIPNAPDQGGACCIADTGACAFKLPWECKAGGDTFQAVGATCAACSNNFLTPCSVNADCPACVGGLADRAACTDDSDCPQGTCSGTATCFLTPPACSITACCNPDGTCDPTMGGQCTNDGSPCNNDAECTGGTCEAQCAAGGGSGFGSTCDPNACQQPIQTGGDNCFDVTVNQIIVPGQGEDPVTVTVSGTNSFATFDEFNDGVCLGGTGAVTDAGTCKDGAACSIAANDCTDTTTCLRDRCDPNIGICTDLSACSVSAQNCADQTNCQTNDAQCGASGGGECTRLCGNARYNPAGGNPNTGWWEAFHVDDCADIRIDFCTTEPVMKPNLSFLQAGCPCGAAVGFSGTLPPIGPDGANEESEGTERGLPFCATDNIWFTFRAIPPGTYYYPLNSTPNSTFVVPPGGDYQFHITAGPCKKAACCVNLCEGGPQDGQPCAPKTCRNGDNPGAECVDDAQCGVDGTCANGGITSCPGIAATCVSGTCVGGSLDGLPCDDLTGEVNQCPGSGVCGATGCAEVTEITCGTANGFWLAGGDFPKNICDGGGTPGAECDTNADCSNGNCIPNPENVSCGVFGGASPCDIGSCCAGPGECEDRSPDSGEPIRRIDCQSPRVFRGGGRCLFVPSPCPVCTVQTDDQCQNPNGGFIVGMDRLHPDIAGAKVADDFIAGSPVIEQFCWWPGFLGVPNTAGTTCADPDGTFGPPADDFEIRFYTDRNGFPDLLVHELAPAVVAAKQWSGPGFRGWRYSAVFDPPLGGFVVGNKYWVEYSGRGNENCRVTLLTSEGGNHFYLQEVDFFDDIPFWTFQDNSGNDQDLAMCIGGTSTPSIVTPPALTGACCQCGGTCTDDVEWTECLGFTNLVGPDEPGGLLNPPPFVPATITGGKFFAGETCAELDGGLGCQNVGAGGGCPGAPSGVAGEDCAFPEIVNTGDNVSYNTVCSTTDGRTSYGDNPGCDNGNPGSFVNDQWFTYHATCSGRVQFDLCGDKDDAYDIMFAVFSNGTSECPTECPPPLDTMLGGGCQDFECSAEVGEPSFEFFGDPGTCYLIRVGGEQDSIGPNIGGSGTGLLQIDCETSTCNLAEPLVLDQISTSSGAKVTSGKNRFLSFSGGDPGRSQAVRIRLVEMPAPYNGWTEDVDSDGLGDTVLWVGEPFALSELSGKDDDTLPTFMAAPLECELTSALFRDWSTMGVVHVFGEAIIPGATYDIQVLDTTCSEFIPSHFSDKVTVVNPRWADAVGPFNAGEWTAPNDSVDVGGDVVAILDKFKNVPTAPTKARADIQPRILDFKINIVDVTRALDGFSGAQYPFTPSQAKACP